MLNEQYILKLIQPCLNSKRELSEFEFFALFSELERTEQYEVVDIMIKNNIDLVDEREEEIKELENVGILHSDASGKDYRKMTHLSNEQLCVMYQQGDTTALAALIEKNKRLVYQMALKISKEYWQQSLTIEDLYIEGNIGLMEAAKKYDVRMDCKFMTYAWYWIRQKIVRSAIDTGYMIRLPVYLFDKIIKVNNCRRRHSDASFNDLLDYLRTEDDMVLSPEKLEILITYSDLYLNTTSLNEVVGEEGNTEIIEFIPDENMNTEDIILGKSLKRDLKEVLETLTEREKEVIDLRFGLTSGNAMSLDQVAYIFSITRERVRQIEATALRKLRHPSKSKKIKDYL